MRTISRLACALACALAIGTMASVTVAAQRHGGPRPPAHHGVEVRARVFIGGYFYDPLFGPYPWWRRGSYPPWYFPTYDRAADLHLDVRPREAAVYVDGFYAGIVDDFDGIFQALMLPPGGHTVVLYQEGLRTTPFNVYLRPGSAFTIHHTMEVLPPSVASERPPVATIVPAPPDGTYRLPRTPPPPVGPTPPVAGTSSAATGFGTLDIRVQPATASIVVDGQAWASTDEGHIAVQVPAGPHRVVIEKAGYERYAADIQVRDAEIAPLNVSLMSK